MSNRADTLQIANNSLENQISSLQSNLDNLQSQYDQLQSQYEQLLSDPSSQSSQITELENQIASLQAQLIDANDIIVQLQGQTGILPVYMDLLYERTYGTSILQLSLQNTGASSITQIFVTLNSVQIPMNFTYLNTTINASTPLPPYQTATGRENVSPAIPAITTYPLIIQALAINGTVYNYQTNITAHT